MRHLYPAKILLLLRSKSSSSWRDLCVEFGFEPDRFHTGHSMLRHTLDELREAGLVDFKSDDKDEWGESAIEGKIVVTKNWQNIQSVLGISLAQLAELEPDRGMVVRPYFGPPDVDKYQHDLFVLMPFMDELRPVYDDHVVKVVSELGLSVARADDFFSADSVMSDVWNAICASRAIIADCTGRNPNVFYEMGMAHVLGKPVILLTQELNDIPFDIRHIRFIEYKYTPRGMSEFEKKLGETIRSVLSV
ncbi:MAG: hypothetical protein FIA90_09775 [candidate division NC10 bacterium]|nr:hypothetical protein [candidate division NC10 bacterium]